LTAQPNDVCEVVRDVLLADSAIAGFVADRVFAPAMPDAATFPLIVIQKASGLGNYTNDGDAGLETARVQVDCYSDGGQAEVNAIRKAVRGSLSGRMAGSAEAPCAIQHCFCINDVDLSEPTTERAGPRLRRRMLEFNILGRESDG
jgi:hypothetical protein